MNKKILIFLGIVLAILLIWLLWPKQHEGLDHASSATKPLKEMLQEASASKNDRDLFKAKEIYQSIILEYPNYEHIESIQQELEDVNIEIICSNIPAPNTVSHQVQSGETLGAIAQKYGTTVDLIKISNNLKSDVIRAGQKLRIWKGHFDIFVDKSQNILILKDTDEVVKVYRVSTGENNSTPVGQFKIINKLIDPVWFNKGIVVPPESPQNVLGSRWLGFDVPGYGIHGTIEPETIGNQVTAGCVRMRNQDVEELYSLVPTGTQVVIVD